MRLDLRKIAEFIRRANTEELLDRVTVYREGMEPAALDLMEGNSIAAGSLARKSPNMMRKGGPPQSCSRTEPPFGVASVAARPSSRHKDGTNSLAECRSSPDFRGAAIHSQSSLKNCPMSLER